MFKKSLKIVLLTGALIVFGLGATSTSGYLAQAQDLASVASSDTYSPQDVFCVKAEVNLGLSFKSGDPDPSIGVKIGTGRRIKCKPGFVEGCNQTGCK